MNNKINCVVLDAVEEDFHPIWEVLSAVKGKLKNETEDQLIDSLVYSLNFLLKSRFVIVYEGYGFLGEQKPVVDFSVNRKFILDHMNDWKNKDNEGVDIRFSISENGAEFLFKHG